MCARARSRWWPAAKPALVQACDLAGCTIRPPRDLAMQYLAINESELLADPAHKGLLVLTANVRSSATCRSRIRTSSSR